MERSVAKELNHFYAYLGPENRILSVFHETVLLCRFPQRCLVDLRAAEKLRKIDEYIYK